MTEESTPVQTSNAENKPEEKKMETYLVAYLDFLGASERMKKDNGKLLNDIANLYDNACGLLDIGDSVYSNLKIKIFSDNIIIAQKVDLCLSFSSFYEKNLFGILAFSSFIQLLATETPGLLMRGGLTMGDFYFDEQFVWGPALLRAHDLESKVAVYPRVLIDTPIHEHISKISEIEKVNFQHSIFSDRYMDDLDISLPENEISAQYHKELTQLMLRDFDGLYYLNYLEILFIYKGRYDFAVQKIGKEAVDTKNPSLVPLLEKIPYLFGNMKKCLLNLTKVRITAKVYSKISWTLTYFNRVCLMHSYNNHIIKESEYPYLPAYCRNKNGENA